MLCVIPIEIINRELDGVLYQALHFAQLGMPTLIGERMVPKIVKRCRKPVFYVDIDYASSDTREIMAFGSHVLSLHPEGINVFDIDAVRDALVESAPQVSTLCTWGEAQADCVRPLLPEDVAGRVVATGHPSFDLARERFVGYYESPDIVERYGRDYILINTNFGYCNHLMGMAAYLEMMRKSMAMFQDEKLIAESWALEGYQRELIGPFKALALSLARTFPERKVVFRPHPVENMEVYREAFREFPNIVVTKEGSVRTWIASAGAVVHHDCTTGVEALFMGKRVVQFRPVFDGTIAAKIPALAGTPVTDPDEVVDMLREPAVVAEDVERQLDSLAPYFRNRAGNAARTIAELARDNAAGMESWMPEPLGFWEDVKCWRKYVSKLIRAHQFGRNGRKVRHSLAKFSSLREAEVRSRLDALRRCEPTLPEVDVLRVCRDTYVIAPVKRELSQVELS